MTKLEILIAYALMILIIIMASMTIAAVNAGQFEKGKIQTEDKIATASSMKTLSVLILVISILGIFGLTIYISQGKKIKEKLTQKV